MLLVFRFCFFWVGFYCFYSFLCYLRIWVLLFVFLLFRAFKNDFFCLLEFVSSSFFSFTCVCIKTLYVFIKALSCYADFFVNIEASSGDFIWCSFHKRFRSIIMKTIWKNIYLWKIFDSETLSCERFFFTNYLLRFKHTHLFLVM